MTLFDLIGRVAVVTGGNGGIGLGMARGLATAGAEVAITARQLSSGITCSSSVSSRFVILEVWDWGRDRAALYQWFLERIVARVFVTTLLRRGYTVNKIVLMSADKA